MDLASTALVGLGEGARYLVEYPYGCAEQRGSRALALLLSADLGEAFKLPGIEPAQLKPTVQASLRELERFQCDNGGFAYWPGACWSTSPYLTAYLLHVFKVAADLKYAVDGGVRDRAYAYLETELAQKPPTSTRAGGPPTPRGRRSRSRCWSKAAATRTRTSRGSTAIASGCRCSRWPI